jgi:preprotein translocase subunit YajC
MLITPAYAQTATTQAGGLTATLVNFGPLVLIGVVMYWFLFRPQQMAQKTLRAQLAALKRGDRVVTAGGIVGTMKKAVEGATEVDVEIAPNVTVSVMRSTITQILAKPEPANDKL